MYRFKLRHILFTTIGLLAVITLALVFSFGTSALKESRTAQRHLAADLLADLLVWANTRIAQERGLTTIALMRPRNISAEELAALVQLREENDRRLDAVMAAATNFARHTSSPQLSAALQQLGERIDALRQARRQADALLQQPQTGGTAAFIDATTALIGAMATLRHISQAPDSDITPDNPIFHETLHTVTEMAGRERALLGGVIAAQRPLTDNELQTLWMIRGVFEGSREKFTRATRRYAGLAGVDAARARMEQAFEGDFGSLRETVLLAGRKGSAYPVDAATWYREATAAIDAVLAYGDTINRLIEKQLERRWEIANTMNYLVGGVAVLIVLIIVGTVLLARLRFILPLQQLEQAALTIGRGDLSRPLRMRGDDELTQLGSAFETMRTGLNEQQQQRRRAEARLEASTRRFRNLVEGLDEIVWEIDDQNRYTYLSPQLESILGYAPEEWLGGEFLTLMPVAECAWLRDGSTEAVERHQPCQGVEHINHHKDGHPVFLESSATPIFDEQGNFRGYRGITRDVSWRRQAEVERQRLLRILDQSGDLILIANQEGIIEYVNSGFEEATGYRSDEVIGQHTRLLKSGMHSDAFYQQLWQTISAGEPFQAAMIDRRKDGELLHIEQTITPLRDADGWITHFASTAKDVTAQRRIDEQMQQSEKLASLGMLAAGVAHEINNPIGYVRANLNSLERYMAELFQPLDRDEMESPTQHPQSSDAPDSLRRDIDELLQETREGVERVRNIVTDLKELSHPAGEDAWQLADLHKGLNSTLNIARSELKHKAKVVCQFGELPRVECLPGQLNQVFLNLLVNAAQAIEQRGVIVIRTWQQGEEVWIEISDTGKGIPPQHLKRLFEPFFTTKPVGQGTGIGLPLSHRIVEKHHGRIEVDSEEGVGSRFRVWLPIRQNVSAGEQTA
ncbi:MAG: PAS domain S-box protein [Gammaproteobacteria bacterium]|nr:PAS domain S-box protein [Gammaproteobacteria bacterium]